MGERHLRALFAEDATRGERMAAEGAGLYLDYSKNRITDETIRLLCRLAEECGLRDRIDAMFRGDKINVMENRAVLQVALRAPRGTSITVHGKDVVPGVHAVLDAMADFSNRVTLSGVRWAVPRLDQMVLEGVQAVLCWTCEAEGLLCPRIVVRRQVRRGRCT